jgi:hypothetical protein
MNSTMTNRKAAPAPTDDAVVSQLVDMASRVLMELDELEDDSKLAAFLSLIRALQSETGPAARVAVVTKYGATLFYLAAALEDLGTPVLILHGGMDAQGFVRSFKPTPTKAVCYWRPQQLCWDSIFPRRATSCSMRSRIIG